MDLGLTIVPLQIEGLTVEETISVESRLEGIFKCWQGTPHRAGQQQKRSGVDCVRFVTAVIDELYGIHTELLRLPQDIAFHKKETAFNAFKLFLKEFPHTKVKGTEIQPGDVLITGPRGGGPGHAIIVGITHLWHCDSQSVVPTGTHLTNGGVYFLKTILRGADRHLWVR